MFERFLCVTQQTFQRCFKVVVQLILRCDEVTLKKNIVIFDVQFQKVDRRQANVASMTIQKKL